MPEAVSIRERIVREVARRVETALGLSAGGCQRFDQNSNRIPAGGALVMADHDDARDGSLGGDDDSITIKTMTCGVCVCITQAEGSAVSTDEKANQVIAKIEAGMMADARLHENSTAVPTVHSDLAHEMGVRSSGYGATSFEEGQTEVMAGIEFAIEYQHYRSDPYNGPGITELQE